MELFIKFLSQIVDAVRYNFSVRILNLKITRIELERFESTIVDGLPNTFKKDFKMSRRIGARLCSTNHTAALQPLVSRSLIESDILYRVNFNLDSHHSLSLFLSLFLRSISSFTIPYEIPWHFISAKIATTLDGDLRFESFRTSSSE